MQCRTIRVLGLVSLVLAFVFAYARATETPAIPTITVTTREFAFQAPDTVEAGPVTIRMINDGNQLHHVWLVRMDGGHSFEDTFAAFQATGTLPAWTKEFGGPNTPRPAGGESNATVVLEPGNYIMACLIPGPDGVPHLMKGMVRPLTVLPSARPAATPKADVVVTLEDFVFSFSRTPRPGRQVIEIRNAGRQSHEMVLVRLAPGKTVQDVLATIEHPEAEQAGVPVGGVTPMSVGAANWISVDLEAGRYALICFIPDVTGDRKPHFMHGMTKEFEVGETHASR